MIKKEIEEDTMDAKRQTPTKNDPPTRCFQSAVRTALP